ncbi:SH3 domain-containing protein [Streptomyces sp. 2333.5]|uniref:SH3 domain-containing protein n=1 Tax=Streptomyces TaxID=1883 RepID=UPI0008945044|nr:MULTISPECIES: SH3 domain-containing protein [unclassified Streptomyces]PJJ03623.1 SH3 domain-containing protein [Streptomyces sp. 2333.5]SED31433.1 SH3 domain-containing protein [Streptomyces sp. 2314.4]SEE52808.1 SH3 domain-containing protein [Streptomyces sp. 2112.2]SOE11990.1 SH3 domain-containing protein [Streptomyces sp. 2323.1]
MTTQDQQSAQEPAEEQALAGGLTYPLAPGHRVNVRQGPSTDSPVVRQLAGGARVQIRCQRHGQRVSGPYGTSDIWDNIAPGQYVSDTYVHTGSSGMVAPRCTS